MDNLHGGLEWLGENYSVSKLKKERNFCLIKILLTHGKIKIKISLN